MMMNEVRKTRAEDRAKREMKRIWLMGVQKVENEEMRNSKGIVTGSAEWLKKTVE